MSDGDYEDYNYDPDPFDYQEDFYQDNSKEQYDQQQEQQFIQQMIDEDSQQPNIQIQQQKQNIDMDEEVLDPTYQNDVIDFLLSNKGPLINQAIENLENCILNAGEPHMIYQRLAKLINFISMRLQQMKNIQQDDLDEITEYISCFFRCKYVAENSFIDSFLIKSAIRINFNKKTLEIISDILLNIEKFAHLFHQLAIDNFRKLFSFMIAPSDPFRNQDRNILQLFLIKIQDLILIEPKYTHFDILCLAYFANIEKMTSWIIQNLSEFSAQLESKLDTFQDKMTSTEQLLLLKKLHFFIVISRNQKISKMLVTQNQLHLNLYKAVKYTDSIFTLDSQQKCWSNDPQLIQTVVILIRSLISEQEADKKFCQLLLDDFLILIDKRKFNFVYSIIVPLLSTTESQFVPICLHKRHQNHDDLQGFLKYLKTNQQKDMNEVNMIREGKISTQIFNEQERDQFHEALQIYYLSSINQQNGVKKGSWRKIIQIDTENNNITFDNTFPKLMGKNNLLFIFNCFNINGYTQKFGAFCTSAFTDAKQKAQQNILDQKGKNIRCMSNDQSFFFYYRQDKKLHFASNERKQPNVELSQKYMNNTKEMVKIVFSGIEFCFDNDVIMYINFGNIDLSKFNVPLANIKFKEVDKLENQDKDFICQPENICLLSAEIWQYDNSEIGEDNNLDAVLNIFSVKDDLQSIYLSYLKQFRMEKIYIVPSTSNISQLVKKFALGEVNYFENVISTKIWEDLDPEILFESLQQMFQSANNNSILDLIINNELLDLTKIVPVSLENTSKKTGNSKLLQYFQNSLQGVSKIINLMSSIAYNYFIQNLMIFFYDLKLLISLESYTLFLLKDDEFFKITLSLLFSVENKKDKNSIYSFHKALLITYKSLNQLLKNNKTKQLRQEIIKNQIFEQILNRLEIFVGPLPSNPKKQNMVDEIKEQVVVQQQDIKKPKYVKPKGIGYSSDHSVGQLSAPKKYNQNIDEEIDYSKSDLIYSILGEEHIVSMTTYLLKCLINVLLGLECDFQLLQRIKNTTLIQIIIHILNRNSYIELIKKQKFLSALLKIINLLASNPYFLDFFVYEQNQSTLYNQLDSMFQQVSFYIQNFKLIPQNMQNIEQGLSEKVIDEQKKQEININSKMRLFIDTFKNIQTQLLDYGFIEMHEQVIEDNEIDLSISNKALFVSFYTPLLKPLCVDSVDMKDGKSYKHYYAKNIGGQNPPQVKINRLMKEISDLANNLPVEATNAIFVRYDKSRMDLMQAIIFGASDTPYAHGAFLYDIYFDDNYPNGPPQVILITTGHGTVRFNPNLYHNGKVCLSLLGTWRGQNAAENWNPNQSTLLQILVSLQAIVMSQYVYYNEPGYEGQMGTEQGELSNVAYSNIVRVSNIKYAMIEQIKNPTRGFEDVIIKSFYLKKDMILKEVKSWIQKASDPATYTGLVSSHNSALCTALQTGYKDMLIKEINLLEIELNNLKIKIGQNISIVEGEKKLYYKINKNKESILDQKQTVIQQSVDDVIQLDEVDVTYDKNVVFKEMDINDQDLLNRQSRTIGAIGLDSLIQQAKSNIFLIGLNALGIEIAKNIVLTGVNMLTIYDKTIVTPREIEGQFFLEQQDIGEPIDESSIFKLQQLNLYVKCNVATQQHKILDFMDEKNPFCFSKYNALILVNQNQKEAEIINSFCRSKNIYFINADIYGVYSRVFVDFGNQFVTVDKDGEVYEEIMIKNIDQEGNVKLIDGVTHNYQDGDLVTFSQIQELQSDKSQKSFNSNQQFKIQIINKSEFNVGPLQGFSKYIRNGFAKKVKLSQNIAFQSLKDQFADPKYDDNMGTLYEDKEIQLRKIINMCMNVLYEFVVRQQRLPRPWNSEDAEIFYNLYTLPIIDYVLKESSEEVAKIILQFVFTCDSIFPPMAAFLGGIIAQEVFKSVTKKWTPINQYFFHSVHQILPNLDFSDLIQIGVDKKILINPTKLDKIIYDNGFKQQFDRYDSLRICLGEKLLSRLQNSKVFLIGVGALGCELLKNFTMLGLGSNTQGKIYITDPDTIENSNLSRQFLFREKHLRKPKASTAAASVIQMNPDMKNRIIIRMDKVCDATENIFDNKFFEKIDVVTNALDNVQARKYVDQRCLVSRISLIDSGTLGAKGHVQVILPFQTETYGSQQDQQEENQIPVCTLKMFPEEAIHSMEWALDKFGKIFNQKIASLQRVIEQIINNNYNNLEEKQLNEALNLLKKRPNNFQDCIFYARKKFQKYFSNDIISLLHVYPLTKTNDDGTLFWTFPKRPPKVIEFDSTNQLHLGFVIACSILRARTFSINIPPNYNTFEGKQYIQQISSKIQFPKFQIKEEKLQQIEQEVNKKQQQTIQFNKTHDDYLKDIFQELKQYFQQDQKGKVTLLKDHDINNIIPKPEIFEKDVDSNCHVDFLFAMTNCRSENYGINFMDWLTIKIKAGRIIPALATTTASIAALQTIELIKIINQNKIDHIKNSFLNFSVPFFSQSEPGSQPIYQIGKFFKISIWDRWDIKINQNNSLLGQFMDDLQQRFNVYPNDITQGLTQIYIFDMMNIQFKQKENQKILKTKLKELVQLKNGYDYVDLNISFTEEDPKLFNQNNESKMEIENQEIISKNYIKGIPIVRVIF